MRDDAAASPARILATDVCHSCCAIKDQTMAARARRAERDNAGDTLTEALTSADHEGRCCLANRAGRSTRAAVDEREPQLTAFFTSSPIRFSSAAVSFVSANEVGHMVPSSIIASSLKPRVEYRVLNLSDDWKKQMTLPSLA